MRIYGDLNRLGADPRDYIIQVGPTPAVGGSVVSNGKFVVDVPEGVVVPDPMPSTLSALLSPLYEGLLTGTGYSFVQYNALLTAADVGDLDLTATFPYEAGPPVKTWATRAQVGRVGAPAGLAANSVKVLPVNTGVTPNRPGLLVTDTIDVSADVPAGVDSFMVYWKILGFSLNNETLNYSIGDNVPGLKTLTEVEQSPTDLEVYASTNDGAGYTRVSRMGRCATCSTGTNLRLAFVNKGSSPIYLAAYAVLY